MPTQLPPKENTLFKRILKCYEQKQYKNGLKFCKQILSNPKFSEHGETLAMKGLTLNYLGKKDEAYDYVKRGLKNDLRSHVCWHVYGLLQRADHKYDEAIKCYRNALKWDKDNLQILRDLSLLQVQMRDLEGFRDTRYQLLKVRPAQRQSWIGYSISYYLLGQYDMAFTVMEEFRKTLFQDNQPKVDIEHTEMLLYQNLILRNQNKDQESIDHFDKYESVMTDKLKVQEIKALQFLKLNKNDEAESIYRELIKRNPENNAYYDGVEKCMKAQGRLNDASRMEIYTIYRKKYPKSEAPKRLPLNFIKGDLFRTLVDEYLRVALKKGVPPLFTSLRSLYQDKEKAKIVEDLVLGYSSALESDQKFDKKDDVTQDPTVLLWTNFYLAQHFDHFRNIDKALEYINLVLDHTPTLIEGYMVKAKIYKHAGCNQEAAKWMDEGRSLDTADRYVNSKCAKYLLRCNEVKKAIETCGLFTKEGILPDDDLDSMQCMWFGIECASAHQRKGEIGEALRKCHQIERNFSEIVEDQFDFHTYCMRKVTLCAYIRLLQLEDVIRSHAFYFKAAKLAIECYLALHDKPSLSMDDADQMNKEQMSEKEFKKLKSKQRRAQKKQQLEEEKKAVEAKETKEPENKKEEGKPKIYPKELVKCAKPLDEAIKFLVPLQTLAKERIETHLMAFEIYYRKGKPLLMLQSIKRAFNCNPTDPRLHECIVRFLLRVRSERDNYNATVNTVLDREIKQIVREDDLQSYTNQFLDRNRNSFLARVAVSKSLYNIDKKYKSNALALLDLEGDYEDLTLQECIKVYKGFQNGDFGATSDDIESYRVKCAKRFKYADLFKLAERNGITDETTSDAQDTKLPMQEIASTITQANG